MNILYFLMFGCSSNQVETTPSESVPVVEEVEPSEEVVEEEEVLNQPQRVI